MTVRNDKGDRLRLLAEQMVRTKNREAAEASFDAALDIYLEASGATVLTDIEHGVIDLRIA